jgi:16S rRNA (cytidine1402-2'-O)-methyltransferase
MLFLIATPIGNLGDWSHRAIDTVRSCSLALCEDTRHTQVLLNHYQIRCPLASYHMFNEARKLESVLERLRAGESIALMTDAGMPAIADPGQRVVAACRAEGLPVTCVPGPCALITALALTGWEWEQFQFVGFLPRTPQARQERLEELLTYPGVSIAYETPHRISGVLEELVQLAPGRLCGVARELTKQYEELLTGPPEQLLKAVKPRGELVLLIGPATTETPHPESDPGVQLLMDQFHVPRLQAQRLAKKLRNGTRGRRGGPASS